MDPSLRSSLFNRMMQAMEPGDKSTADKIESLIRNFRPGSPVPISVYVPSSEDAFIPDISPPSSDSDFPTMPRSSKPSGSRRRASRAPRGSLLDAQTTVDSDVDDHQRDRLNFSFDRPCSFDTEVNVVGEAELSKFKSRFGIPDSVTLILPGGRAAWNPPENAVAIYGAMLSCGITLPLQPFIARFLAEAKIAPAQLSPNSYRILMCLGLMWKLKGYGSPTPREIRHFYTLRQAGNSGTYFLLSSPVENWIPEGVSNPGQVEVSSDEKKKGFIWGFPSSNKRWKNSWFFVGGEWGRNVSANSRLSLAARKVPRHFTSPDAWSKTVPVLLDAEISHLAAAAVLPLDERGRSFLLDEGKMIAKGLFPRLPARLPRLYDFDRVCDLQARAVKNSEAASKRHAAGLAKEGVASPDGGDPSDDEDTGDVDGERVELRPSPVCPGAAASIPAVTDSVAASTTASTAATAPSRKGKEKVGVSGVASEIPIFDANVPKTPLDPSSDLNPRTGRDEEVAEEPVLAEVPSAETTVPGASVEGPNLAESSFPEGVSSFGASAIPPTSATPPPVAAEKPSTSFAGQPGSPGRQGPTDKPGSSRQDGAAASGSGVAHGAPPVDPAEAGEGDESVSLSDFTTAEIFSYIMNNNVYVGESWEQIKKGSCNKKMKFFFNCYSLMLSELTDNYRRGNFLSRDLKRLREQSSLLEAEKLEAEENHAQQLAQLRESTDGHLSAQLTVEEKLGVAEEEIRLLREQLSASQESLAARLEVERLTEDAKEKAEREAADLRNQLASHEVILTDLKAVLEVEAVDRFKRSPAYDALLLREFEKGMRQAKKFFAMKDHSTDKALRRFDRSLQQHMASGVGSIKEQIKRWRAHCRYNRTDPHPMHLEIPSKRAFNTYYSGQKGSFSGSDAEPDLGPVAGRDYEPFMLEEDEEVTWPSEEEVEDEEDSEGPPTAG
ncbi:hypothetical protein LWI29_015694 [Acer saccharum]|uniref:Uncharacterized protein n=1 Tax=Acer saccharum TaxID=4024 RepID=A0AA39VG61_ACESA|nr:hypothetical protein LWI29_015694 [Acer saccharum]